MIFKCQYKMMRKNVASVYSQKLNVQNIAKRLDLSAEKSYNINALWVDGEGAEFAGTLL